MKKKQTIRWFSAIIICMLFVIPSCTSVKPLPGKHRIIRMKTTGYCPCGKCCGWKRNWRFKPVYASGPNKGKPKQVGITADGSKAVPGVIAADTRYYPFKTRMFIPGYGNGEVHDRGSAIQGPAHIDLFFKSHTEALEWGVRIIDVYVYYK